MKFWIYINCFFITPYLTEEKQLDIIPLKQTYKEPVKKLRDIYPSDLVRSLSEFQDN